VTTWLDLDERDDHYLGLPGAHVVATESLLRLRDNLADVVEARAMMCVHGDAGLGKTLSVNASLRALAPEEVCRVQFRARPTSRDIRHVLFDALGLGGAPPSRPTDIAIVFVGGDCYRVLRREPMLSSRVYVWQEFRRMTLEQVLDVIPVYHPAWAKVDAELIAYADLHAAHGDFRAWSKITAHVQTALRRLDRDQVDREVLQWVFSRLGGRDE
jgi:AAA domain-containing protein